MCWGILIYFILLYQIGMAHPAYDLPGRFHIYTTHIIDTYVGNRLPLVVSLEIFFQVCRPASSL